LKDYGSVTHQDITYKTVVIGTQNWMAENITRGSSTVCYGNTDPDNCEEYIGSRLYNWAEAMALPSNYNCNSTSCASRLSAKHKGICPSGWHIPDNDEWRTLLNFVGNNQGTKLKSASGWYNNGNGTDDFGFTSLPDGYGVPDGGFYGGLYDAGKRSDWWTASEYNASEAYYWELYYNNTNIVWGYYDKSYKFNVRCVQD
jgi:uncharacterized protein (TIGR02145 family)